MPDMSNILVSDMFKALAHPTRLKIVKLLQGGEMCVCDILQNLDAEQSNTSQHLTVLKNQGVVKCRKEGAKVLYSIKNEEVYEMINLAEKIILWQVEMARKFLSK